MENKLKPFGLGCSVCENYQRKIEQVERTLSGRETVIEALKKKLERFEVVYKNLIDEHEQLRFDHTTTLQNNISLKKITSQSENCSSIRCCRHPYTLNKWPGNNSGFNFPVVLQEVGNIDKLVKTQSTVLRELIEKLLTELKLAKDNYDGLSVSQVEEEFKQIESGDHLETGSKFKQLTEEVEKLRSLVESHQKENYRMRQLLQDKKDRLAPCTNFDTAIVSTIDVIMDPQEVYKQLQQREKHWQECSCQMIDQLEEMQDNNQTLSETLAIVTEENKNNVQLINNLKDELNKTSRECDNKLEALRARISELENELDDGQLREKKLKERLNTLETETIDLNERLKTVLEENSKLDDCKCDVTDIKNQLMEKSLEISEYEEENKALCQKLDYIDRYNQELIMKIQQLQEELTEKPITQASSMQTMENTTEQDLQTELTRLTQEKETAEADLEAKTRKIASLQDSIKMQLEELDRLGRDNEELRAELEQLRCCNKAETERLQALVNQSQKQVQMLLKEHDEKTAQIQAVANELDKIRNSVIEDTQKYLSKIKCLEEERDALNKKIQAYGAIKDCDCSDIREDMIKKQCIIMELERSVDNFNETLKNLDKTVEQLVAENSQLKAENQCKAKELEALRANLAPMCQQLEEASEKLRQSEAYIGNCNTLNSDKEKLEELLNKLQKENAALKQELCNCSKEKGVKEMALIDNCQLQMELDSLKRTLAQNECTSNKKLVKLQMAYDEIKNLYDKLKKDFSDCSGCKEALQMSSSKLQEENERLKNQVEKLLPELKGLRSELEQLRGEHTKKCLEVERLRETVSTENKKKQLCEMNCEGLTKKNTSNEKELAIVKEKLAQLQANYEQKSQELQKMKKQWECCAKQSQISREEYNNLRKEYKEIKTMLSEQIKKYKADLKEGAAALQTCPVMRDLKRQLLDKEDEIGSLQRKLQEASCEIIELKDYVQKLICDNNVLKSAINELISNLERKIKGPSFDSLPKNSADAIAGQILKSLTTVEEVILKNCPGGCHLKECSCMSEITSQYNAKETSCPPPLVPCKAQSEPLRVSEANTSDSDDPNPSFMDQKSVDFLKTTIQDLKTKMDQTMKEKSCDCESSHHKTKVCP